MSSFRGQFLTTFPGNVPQQPLIVVYVALP